MVLSMNHSNSIDRLLKLIEVVKSYPVLWCYDWRTSSVRTNELWKEVGLSLGTDDWNEVKDQWQALRNYFRKQLRKARQNAPEGCPIQELKSQWPLFKPMLFLGIDMERRLAALRLAEDTAQSRNSEPEESLPMKPGLDLQVEEKGGGVSEEVEEGEAEDDDEVDLDVEFFASLYPYLQTIPPEKRARLQFRLQRLIIEAAYGFS